MTNILHGEAMRIQLSEMRDKKPPASTEAIRSALELSRGVLLASPVKAFATLQSRAERLFQNGVGRVAAMELVIADDPELAEVASTNTEGLPPP